MYFTEWILHSAIYYLTPEDVLCGRTEERLKERQQKLDAARAHRLKLNQGRNVA
ncbi:hypothetical protein ACX8XP_12015 [Calditrichota bacterium LG25]